MQILAGAIFIQADQEKKSGRLGRFLNGYDSFLYFNILNSAPKGKTPMETFKESIILARLKFIHVPRSRQQRLLLLMQPVQY